MRDYFTSTEADAGEYERHWAEPDDDRPSLSDLAEEGLGCPCGHDVDRHDQGRFCIECRCNLSYWDRL